MMLRHAKFTFSYVVSPMLIVTTIFQFTLCSTNLFFDKLNEDNKGIGDAGNERAIIQYNSLQLEKIDLKNNVLRKIGNDSSVSLQCFSSRNNATAVDWKYKANFNPGAILDEHEYFLFLPTSFPVILVECVLNGTERIKDSILIYGGSTRPPYFYNSGKSVRPIFKEMTITIPCVLNYPLENLGMELQLRKDGEIIGNNTLKYIPEEGYIIILDPSRLKESLGQYQCEIVINKVNGTVVNTEDKVLANFSKDKLIQLEYFNGVSSPFYKTQKRRFTCKLPKSIYKNKFEWFYFFKNGTCREIPKADLDSTIQTNNPDFHYETVNVKFSTLNISQVVCAGITEDSSKYNYSLPITILEVEKPELSETTKLISKEPILFEHEKNNLTCELSKGSNIKWEWLENGKTIVFETGKHNSSKDLSTRIKTLFVSRPYEATNYTCIASNLEGNVSATFFVQPSGVPTDLRHSTQENREWLLVLILVVLVVIFGVICLILTIWMFPRSGQLVQVKEIPLTSIIFEHNGTINDGNFGVVCRVRKKKWLIGRSSTLFAAKRIKHESLNTEAEKAEAHAAFLKEIGITNQLKHKHVVKCIGAVTKGFHLQENMAYLIMEYCCGGSLSSFLINNREFIYDDINYPNISSSTNTRPLVKLSYLLKWAKEIALGVEYLGEKGIIHMDLCAKNILLGYQEVNPSPEDCPHPQPGLLVAKISDFGLSRQATEEKPYYQIMIHPIREKTKKRVFQIRWLAFESLESFRFGTFSDIWAMGVTFWEMFWFGGKIPYGNSIPSHRNEDPQILRNNLVQYLRRGNRLPKPPSAPTEFWDLMQTCWTQNYETRPKIKNIIEQLHSLNSRIQVQAPVPVPNGNTNPIATHQTPRTVQNGYLQLHDQTDNEIALHDLNTIQ